MILVDANVFMYAAGSAHPNKDPSEKFLAQVADGRIDAAIDAEVLQEILHRYRSIKRWTDGRNLFDLVLQIVPLVVPITVQVVIEARLLMDQYPLLSARDALHAAACIHESAEALCSYDKDLDIVAGISRIEPTAFLKA